MAVPESPMAEVLNDTLAESTETGVLFNLHSLFTPSEEKTFIKRIFQKDELLFRESLDQLNRMSEWKDASQYLQQIFITNDVDPFSEEAILFTDKVQRRFLPGEEAKREAV